MRRTLSVVAVALAAAALTPAAASAKPCPKGTATVGAVSKPTACLTSTPPTPLVAVQQAVAGVRSAQPKARKGKGKRNARAAKLAREAFAFAQTRAAAGEPIFLTAPKSGAARRAALGGAAHRAAAAAGGAGGNATVTNAPASFGNQVSTSVDSNGRISTEFRSADLTLQMQAQKGEFSLDIRDRSGAGGFMKFGSVGSDVPRCPTAAGDVPSKFDTRLTWGEATAEHGVRSVVAVTIIFDGDWHGYVGVGGRAERFDVAMRGALEVRTSSEMAGTGKVLRRDPTRTYRSVLDRKAIPVGTDGKSVLGGARLFGPKGAISSSIDRTLGNVLAGLVAQQVDAVSAELKVGDGRWYDQRLCARTSLESYRPEHVTKGATANWQVRATDVAGQVVTDAQWTVSSTCGQLAAEATRGPTLRASVADAAGKWGPDPYAPGCLTAEVTSTAGRAATFTHTIEPKKPDGYRFTIAVTYNETIGSGVAETNMTGTGSVFLPWNEDNAEGTGTYEGTEWDGTVANPCGEDMGRSRGYSGKAIVGVHRNRDGTFSVAFTAAERPLRHSFLAIVPATGGAVDSTGKQPFCGEAGRAKTTTKLVVTSAAVPAEVTG